MPRGPVPHEYTLHPVQGDATGHVDCSIDGIQGPGASFGYRIWGGFLGDDRILGECGADCSDDLPLDRHIDIGHRVVDAGDGVLPADPSDVSDEGPRIDEGFAQNLQLLRMFVSGSGCERTYNGASEGHPMGVWILHFEIQTNQSLEITNDSPVSSALSTALGTLDRL